MKILGYDQLKPEKGIPYTRRHLQRLVKTRDFPTPISLSDARIAWLEAEIDDWIAARAAERPQRQAA